MRILHCIPNLAGGGAERQLTYLVTEQVNRGYDVHVAFLRGGENLHLLERSGAIIHWVEASSSYDLRILWRLSRLFRNIRPDVVQTWLIQMDVAAGVVARFNRIPVVLSERSQGEAYGEPKRRQVREWVGARATVVVANSRSGLHYWSFRGNALDRVIPNGFPVATEDYGPAAYVDERLLAGDAPLVLFAGRYHDNKNVGLLIEALVLVLQKAPGVKALLLGDGPLRPSMESRVVAAGLSERLVVGPYATNVRRWMRAAACFVLPSHFEGQPNAVVEAALEGCPLVLSDITTHRELFGEDAAIFVDPMSADNICEAILRVLANPLAASERASHALAAVMPYSIPRMVDAYGVLYDEIVSGRVAA